MKFICFCYYDPKIANALSPSEMEALSAACQPHYEAWEKTGKLAALGGLSDPQAWKTIRPTDTLDNTHSQPIIANGPSERAWVLPLLVGLLVIAFAVVGYLYQEPLQSDNAAEEVIIDQIDDF